MLSHKITLIAKIDPLKYFLSKSILVDILEKRVMVLSEFEIGYMDCKSIKGKVIEDRLENAPLIDEYTIHDELLGAKIM